jgi:hypothetical protein
MGAAGAAVSRFVAPAGSRVGQLGNRPRPAPRRKLSKALSATSSYSGGQRGGNDAKQAWEIRSDRG